MAISHKQFSPIQQRNEWSAQQKSALFKVLSSATGALSPQTAPAALTVSTGGTSSNTLAAMTVTEPANFAAVAAQLAIIQNSIRSLGDKINATRTALSSAGVFV